MHKVGVDVSYCSYLTCEWGTSCINEAYSTREWVITPQASSGIENKCTHTWVMYVCIFFTIMPRIWMRHTARVGESNCYSHDDPLPKTAHTHESCIFGVFCHNCAKYVNEAYGRCVWVMLHAYMSHVRVRVMSKWDMPHTYMSHAAHIHEWDMPHTYMPHTCMPHTYTYMPHTYRDMPHTCISHFEWVITHRYMTTHRYMSHVHLAPATSLLPHMSIHQAALMNESRIMYEWVILYI